MTEKSSLLQLCEANYVTEHKNAKNDRLQFPNPSVNSIRCFKPKLPKKVIASLNTYLSYSQVGELFMLGDVRMITRVFIGSHLLHNKHSTDYGFKKLQHGTHL